MFPSLHDDGVDLRHGQLALVAAGPGVGKSAFMLNWALKAKVPTLYFSADSDAFTQLTRSISVLKGHTLSQSAKLVINDTLDEVEYDLIDLPVRFNYNASPTIENIETTMRAFEEVYGDYPSLVIIDNVTNVITDGGNGDDPFAGLEPLMDYLNTMARETQACVVGLHHVTGAYNDGDKPIPMSGIKGQIGRVPSLILTLHKVEGIAEWDTLMCVSCVKNRMGKADPSGESFTELVFIGETMTIKDAA